MVPRRLIDVQTTQRHQKATDRSQLDVKRSLTDYLLPEQILTTREIRRR
jgi:hypothetical protein